MLLTQQVLPDSALLCVNNLILQAAEGVEDLDLGMDKKKKKVKKPKVSRYPIRNSPATLFAVGRIQNN